MLYRLAILAISTVAVTPGAAVCQPSADPAAVAGFREKSLAMVFKTKELVPPKTTGALAGAPGRVWQRSVEHSGSTLGIRIHVVVASAKARQPWRLKVLDGVKVIEVIESTSPLIASGDFWTLEIPGKGATLEIWSDGDPSGIELRIDEYAFRVSTAIPQATVGNDDKQPIGTAPAEVKALAPPIARLSIMTEFGGAYCTGFLITEALLMTNEHCVASQKEAESTVAEFGYDSEGDSKSPYRGMRLEALDKELDYAVVRMTPAPGPPWKRVTLAVGGILTDGAALVVVQHPEGRPKMAAVIDCKVNGNERAGFGVNLTDFGHTCDTLGGSSGSPIFLRSSGEVVGLHHLVLLEGIDDPVNQGVNFERIVKDVKTRYPALGAEIAAAVAP